MCELPPELYREILQHVPSKHDLCALSVTSRAFQAEAEFFIYQSIKSTRRLRTESICNLIIHCPRVRPLVHSLSISSEDYNRLGPLDYWRSVAQALENLPNLEVLRISDCMDKTNAWVFGRCTFQLTELDCDFDLDDAFISFLRGQRALKSLSWMYTHPGINAIDALPKDPQFLPSLRECITNSPSFAVKLMSCHSLTHVWVSGPCAYDQESWLAYIARFSDYTSALRSLRLNFPYNKRNLIPVLSALAKQAPELRSLGFLPSFTMQETNLIAAISQFRQLQSLATWSVITADTSRALAEACPSLRLVACLHYSYSHEYVFLPINPIGVPRAVHDPEYRLWRDA